MSGRKRKAVTPWEACGESREDYEAWERREFAAALTSAGIDPTLEGAPLVGWSEGGCLVSPPCRACRWCIFERTVESVRAALKGKP